MHRCLRLLLLAALCACARPPQPSPEYAQARELWTRLVLARGVDAADDPQAAEVLALLERVPAESADARDASELLARVKKERQTAADERAHRAKLVAKAAEPTPVAPAGLPNAAQGAGARPAPAAPAAAPAAAASEPAAAGAAGESAPTAGKAPPRARPPLAPGLTLEAFKAGYGDCFEERGPVEIDAPGGKGPARAGTMWGMKDLIACREKLPQHANQLALFADGALVGLGAKDKLRTERRQVELGTLPDGQLGIKEGGKVVPLPPGAALESPAPGKPAAAAP